MKTYQLNSAKQRKIIDAESQKIYKKNFPTLKKSEQRRMLRFLSKKYGKRNKK
jgi:hypothetical protein